MLWIEKVGAVGGQLVAGFQPECMICRETINNGEVCIGMRKVHDLAIHFPYHPRRFLEEEERLRSDDHPFNENYFDDCKQDNDYVHTDCYPYQLVRPYACMFDDSSSNASLAEQKQIHNLISDWQYGYRTLNAKTKKRKADNDDESEKKTKTSKSTATKRKRKTKKESTDSASSSTSSSTPGGSSSGTDYSWMNAIDCTNVDSPFLFGLSDDAWYEILSYLPHYSIVKASQSCKALYLYSNRSILWENLASKTICPNAKQVQQEYFPTLTDDFKKVFRLLYNNCCVICGDYIRKGEELDNRKSLYRSKGGIIVESNPFYYNFMIDQCHCSTCSESPLTNTFTRTNAKTLYRVTDTELGCTRNFAKPNPYSPSVAMGIFLELQVKIFHLQKVEEELRKNFKKSKTHSKSDYLKIIDKAKRGDYGKDCKLYIFLNDSNKKICKDKAIYTYIDELSP